MQFLSQEIRIITGSNSGIGKETAISVAETDATTVLLWHVETLKVQK